MRTRPVTQLRQVQARVRDFHQCQVPGCPVRGVGRVESARIIPRRLARAAGDFTTLCPDHAHTGPISLGLHTLDARPQTVAGGDGLIHWYFRTSTVAPWLYIGASQPREAPHAYPSRSAAAP